MDMKDLSLHGLIGGGSNIKSIQSGVFTMSAISNDIPISPIDITKSIIIISVINPFATSPNKMLVQGQIISTTAIRIGTKIDATASYYPTVNWQVIEFENVKSLQKGDYFPSPVGSEVAIAVSNININKSLLIVTWKHSSTTTSGSAVRAFSLGTRIIDETSIGFNANLSGTYTHWQLIEFN